MWCPCQAPPAGQRSEDRPAVVSPKHRNIIYGGSVHDGAVSDQMKAVPKLPENIREEELQESSARLKVVLPEL